MPEKSVRVEGVTYYPAADYSKLVDLVVGFVNAHTLGNAQTSVFLVPVEEIHRRLVPGENTRYFQRTVSPYAPRKTAEWKQQPVDVALIKADAPDDEVAGLAKRVAVVDMDLSQSFELGKLIDGEKSSFDFLRGHPDAAVFADNSVYQHALKVAAPQVKVI